MPRWTREPSLKAIESVCRRQLGPKDACMVSFYAAGAFNKLYLGFTANPLLIRAALPVHPHYNTRGEVTTLQWVRDNTSIPVPKVVAFQDNNGDKIGFKWILIKLMPGLPADRRWRNMPRKQKEAFISRLAEFQAQLSRCSGHETSLRNIGTLEAESEQ